MSWGIGLPGRYLWWLNPPNTFQRTVDPILGIITTYTGKPGVFLMQSGNVGQDISSIVSNQLASKIASPSLVWTSPVEPGSRTGAFGLDLLGVAMLPDASLIDDVAVVQSGKILAGSENVDNLSLLPFSGGLPTPRSSFQTVLSRTAGAMFVLGGVAPVTQSSLTDIWMQVTGQRWAQLHLAGYSPHAILASTFSYADRHLWVLDELQFDSEQNLQIRLLRIDPFAPSGATYAVVAVGQPASSTSYFLSVDHDGALLLTAVSPSGTVLTRITAEAQPHIRVVRFEAAQLVRGPIIDDFGYSFILLQSDGTFSVERHSHSEGNCDGIPTPLSPVP
jgi:hypothetical protein